jgi:hypothetical protein
LTQRANGFRKAMVIVIQHTIQARAQDWLFILVRHIQGENRRAWTIDKFTQHMHAEQLRFSR